VRLGINNLTAKKYKPLKNARVGLCTNISSCDAQFRPTISLLSRQKDFELKAIFAPEHGLFGALQDQVQASDYYDRNRKIKVYSLYSTRLIPDQEIKRKVDILVIDLQDIGTRYYTFLWSAVLLIEQMARLNIPILVLDRPNPLNGKTVQGPVIEPNFVSFVGLYLLPVRHGMTIGELCSLINEELELAADLKVIRMKGWSRHQYFYDTGLPWTMPSPNMPSFKTALVYPGMCLLEGTNISEGRGTTRPFEIFGAPWIDPFAFVAQINKKKIPGVQFRPISFVPTFNKFKDRLCGGAQIYVTNIRCFNAFTTALDILKTIRDMYPKKTKWRNPPYEFERHKLPFDILVGNSWIKEALEDNQPIQSIRKRWQIGLYKFKLVRKKYLLY
jgi:uncharacterized protein YbbC (DUF1343 family)